MNLPAIKHVIVTGAASGIGCQVATQLLAAGHRVLVVDIDEASLARVATRHAWPADRVGTLAGNVASEHDWARVMKHVEPWPQLDALVNVAGVLRVEPVGGLKSESIHLQMDVNAKGVILGTQSAAARMIAQAHGRIVNVASLAALAPVPGIAVYSASKYAVRGFSLAAAEELAPHGVQVSLVYPDAVATPMVDYQLNFPSAALTFSGPRILTAEEVARSIVQLVIGKYRSEVVLPRSRGWLAKVSNLLPRGLRRRMANRLTHKGMARQNELRRSRPDA